MSDYAELDEKIFRLIKRYRMQDYQGQRDHHDRMKKGRQWARDNILNNAKILGDSTDEVFILTFREMFNHFNGRPARLRFNKNNIGIIEIRNDFIKGVRYLIDSDDDTYSKVDNLVNGEYKVYNLGYSVWSYLAAAKDPSSPIIDQKIIPAFFDRIGIGIGVGKEKIKIVKTHYDRWIDHYNENQKLDDIDYIDIDHMIHYSQTADGGERFMDENFGSNRK